MKYGIYSCFDQVSHVYHGGMYLRTEAEAMRLFSASVLSDDFMRDHASDFALYIVGSFDDEDGKITACNPRLVMHGSDIKYQRGADINVSDSV